MAETASNGLFAGSYSRFQSNALRALALALMVSERWRDLNQPSAPLADVDADITRASLVFAHAALDDYLRNLARHIIPRKRGALLKKIPFAGTDCEKLSLCELSSHGGKTVQQVIEESVADHLRTRSLNSGKEIGGFVHSIGIDLAKLKHLLPDVDLFVKRRHLIVHQADHATVDSQAPAAMPISEFRQIVGWLRTCIAFGSEIYAQLLEGEGVPPGETAKFRRQVAELPQLAGN